MKLRGTRNPQGVEVREAAPGRFLVNGLFEFETARVAHAQGLALIEKASGPRVEIDCAGVTRADSAGLAVLVDWMAVARQKRLRLCVLNIPTELRAIASISEADRLLEEGIECAG